VPRLCSSLPAGDADGAARCRTGNLIAVDRALDTTTCSTRESLLQHDNSGRGVVLGGHSQGSALTQLINEIDGKPRQSKLISALSGRHQPRSAEGKGRRRRVSAHSACHSASWVGCAIAHVVPIDDPAAGQLALRRVQARTCRRRA
jgi:hypothetical protein